MAFRGNLGLLKKMAEAADLEGQGSKKIFERLSESEGSTPLHAAANGGKIYVCKYLIEDLKLDVNMKDINGNSPLIHAIMGLQLSTTLYLIENGANLALADDQGLTALHYAASIGFEEILQLLISKGAVVDAKSIEGTPLQCASGHGHKEAVKILLKHNADPNSFVQNFSPLILSVISESQECLDLLLEARANPDTVSCGATPLGAAVLLGNRVAITRLLKAGANANATNWEGVTPLEMAALLNGENCEEVMTILFPMTRRIPSILEWTIDGIVKHVQSNEAMQQRELKRNEYFLSSNSKGRDFFRRDDYMKAVYWYTEAITADPYNATVSTVLSNRSHSYARLNEGILALADAEACINIKPDWAGGYYLTEVALKLLGKYDEAMVAYRRAVDLDTETM